MTALKNYQKKIFLPGALRRIVILGLGQLTPVAAEFAVSKKMEVVVFSGSRQSMTKNHDGILLTELLAQLRCGVEIIDDIKSDQLGPYELGGEDSLLLSFGSPYIVGSDLLEVYGGKAINSHGAPLPEWRGGGGFSWRILAGDRRGNTCFHLICPGIDKGDIIYQRSYEFPETARYPKDYARIAHEHATVGLRELLSGLLEGKTFEISRQNEEDATYFPRLHTETQGWIDWSWPGEAIERFVLAFSYPYEGAQSLFNGIPVYILDCRFEPNQRHPHSFFNGLIYRINKGEYFVACDDGTLVIPQEHFVVKKPPSVGDRLFTPRQFLEEALSLRPVYTPSGMKKKVVN